MQSDEVQPRHPGNNSTLVDWTSVFPEYWQVDPRETRLVSGAPDHVGDFQNASILQHRPSVANSYDSRDPLYSGVDQFLRLHAYQGSSTGQQFRPQFPADWRAQ